MYRETKHRARNENLKSGNRPVLTSYDSGNEHSWEHWADVQKLVATEDKEKEAAEQLIRQRAYEFYERRGKQDGYDLDDWLRAETELIQRARAAAA